MDRSLRVTDYVLPPCGLPCYPLNGLSWRAEISNVNMIHGINLFLDSAFCVLFKKSLLTMRFLYLHLKYT